VTKNTHIPWPSLDAAYVDEFGSIEADVYGAAGDLWPLAELYSINALQDAQIGQRLLLKAAAIVSRVSRESPEKIVNLKAYLYQTFKRMMLAQLEHENGHRRLEATHLSEGAGVSDSLSIDIDQKILIQQIMRRMDEGMREIFKLLILGHTFEEIGSKLNQNPHRLRTKFSKQLMKLKKRIEAETIAAEKKSLEQQ
jgi:DNA-directed RNA polymerase specialized sigma24 family protein